MRKNTHRFITIVRTIFEAEAEPRILPSASDRAEEAQTRILPLAIQNCPDYCYNSMQTNYDVTSVQTNIKSATERPPVSPVH